MNYRIVIHKFTTKTTHAPYAPGIADFFKGSIALHQYASLFNYKLYLDFSEHPIYNFLEKNEYPPVPDDFESMPTIQLFETFSPLFVKQKLLEGFATSNIIKVKCNLDYESEPDNETIAFILQNFRPINSILTRVDNIIHELKLGTDFITIHVRAGDTFMIENSNCDHDNRYLFYFNEKHTHNLIKYIDTFCEHYNNKVFLMSDNIILKKFVAQKYNFQATEFVPMHSGSLAKESVNERSEELLIEFFIMCRSKQVICYSWAGHSGFSDMANILYKIPLNRYFI